MDIYRNFILDHYRHPRNYGRLGKSDISLEEENTSCGDRIHIDIMFHKVRNKNTIHDIRFTGDGCAISQASTSLLTEYCKGKSIDDVMAIDTKRILSLLQTPLTPSRIKCATLSLEIIHKAIRTYYQKNTDNRCKI
jgi:nitrogen fixation NifU-like protein